MTQKKNLIISMLLAVLLALIIIPTKTASATDYSEEPFIMDGVWAAGTFRTDNHEDTYKIVVPSAGTVTLYFWYSTSYDYADSWYHTDFNLLNKNKNEIKSNRYSKLSRVEDKPSTITYYLEKGTYYISLHGFYNSWNNSYSGYGDYHLAINYECTNATTAKLSSPAKGKVKVTATKGDKCTGFEVKYRMIGSKKWTTETVKTAKNLNKTFTGFKSGKRYVVQVRKYITDSYGYTYYSEWTQETVVKIK